jgi:hypothetical protein
MLVLCRGSITQVVECTLDKCNVNGASPFRLKWTCLLLQLSSFVIVIGVQYWYVRFKFIFCLCIFGLTYVVFKDFVLFPQYYILKLTQ